ncbi:MAG: hypothetical protein REI96_18295 [Flavobacterium nitrogenifigens]|uniref:Uncharacterized protein n=1 Tax=Flavobacterium nitrogenifigens TaxID=1617283 RepID=A0A521BQK4_9FLAO|nr:hypothetical protein [Flavobacterium nitrogenifigens]KAF2330800.1 hypothetical protein DM397_13465 [Flavobacterium nitrogenifigens]MDQ8014404.1 hypothetical protein [Flavobacterium nitrogenifigens]SMO49031.1 hypothetical protein SAMN06265220_1011196 [Flavobacterium nitrogenifigens]
MLKSILNFKGVEILNRDEQRSIKAGDFFWDCQTGEGGVMTPPYIAPCIDQPVEIIPAPEFDLP